MGARGRLGHYGDLCNNAGYTGAANRIYGLDGNDELHGNSGNDVLSGGAGDDLLYGQSGDDVLDGGAGNDTLKGSTGNDSYVVDSTKDSVVEASGSGTDTVLSSLSYTLPTNVENLTLAADAGDIDAAGNTLANALIGNGGNNVLNGGAGADTLTGGEGTDTYELTTTTGGTDLITDFLSGTDTIRINDLASGLGLGDKDGFIDNATTVPGLGGFSASNELVIVTGDISGLITAASAAATIGSAASAYALGYVGLFVVDNGTDSALFKFVSSAADSVVSGTELTLIGTLQGTTSTMVSDYVFGI
jgi:Ca2+-binding RTX toxin-like protein